MALTDTLIIELDSDDSTSQPVDLLQSSSQIEMDDSVFVQNTSETTIIYP